MKAFIGIVILSLLPFVSPAQGVQVDEDGFETFEYKDGDTTYLMKKYFFCMLKSVDDKPDIPQEEIMEIQKAHLAHLSQMADDKQICMAGPLGDHPEWAGIVVFSVPTIDEAKTLMGADPAVKAGRLRYEIVDWWAAKGTKLF